MRCFTSLDTRIEYREGSGSGSTRLILVDPNTYEKLVGVFSRVAESVDDSETPDLEDLEWDLLESHVSTFSSF